MTPSAAGIYLDHAATTPPIPEALEAWVASSRAEWGNPSSLHARGQEASRALRAARSRIASALGADPVELLFSASGSESNNWALRGAFRAQPKLARIAISSIEHPSVHFAAERLAEERGLDLRLLPCDGTGRVDLGALADCGPETFVSVMAVNNETGVPQDLASLARLRESRGFVLHVDATQALGKIPVDLRAWKADLATFAGHKCGAPRGAAILFRRKSLAFGRLLDGGGQELGLRAGTENVAGACALAEAVEKAVERQGAFASKVSEFTKRWKEGLGDLPGLLWNGEGSAGFILNFSLEGLPSDLFQIRLSGAGLAVSGGSACSSGAARPSRVLTAMGLPKERIASAIRVSFGWTTEGEEVDEAARLIRETARSMRGGTP